MKKFKWVKKRNATTVNFCRTESYLTLVYESEVWAVKKRE